MSPDRLFLFRAAPQTDAQIVNMILAHEGGVYTNDPDDRGGPTKWGITQWNLSQWRGRPVTAEEVAALERDEAAAIYVARYIRPFDRLPQGVLRPNVIDMGVNAGVSRAARLLQQCVGVTVDGKIGPQTIEAVNLRDWNSLYVGFRLAFYERLIENDQSQMKWRRGWRNRALSFLGRPRLRRTTPDNLEPVFGFMGKAG